MESSKDTCWDISKASKVSCNFPEVVLSWLEQSPTYRLCVDWVLMNTFWSCLKRGGNHQIFDQKLIHGSAGDFSSLNFLHGTCMRSHRDAVRRVQCLASLPPSIVMRPLLCFTRFAYPRDPAFICSLPHNHRDRCKKGDKTNACPDLLEYGVQEEIYIYIYKVTCLRHR